MRLWTLFKLIALVAVLGVMGFTALFAYHITVAPLGGVFEKLIPNPSDIASKQEDADFAEMLDSAEMPDIDPGEKAFQKAHELLALGKLVEAQEKLTAIVNVFPSSPSAPVARRIVGQMNLDEVLSSSNMAGKKSHVVKRGNSFLSIASEYKTTLDSIMHFNGMIELKNIQPGEEMIVMPLEFRILIEPQRGLLSVWDGGRFICDYPIIHVGTTGKLSAGKTTISSKLAEREGRRIAPQSKDYRGADKIIQIAKPSLYIRGGEKTGDESVRGIILRPQDIEELSLLTRVGNEVEIR